MLAFGMKNIQKLLLSYSYGSCDTCLKFHKTPPRPVACLPLAREFNEAIVMDLKILKGNSKNILYLIDMFTRFTTARIIQ